MTELRARYFQTLRLGKNGTPTKCELKGALDRAYELRTFEIEHYWKRGTYFWGFQIAIFAAFEAYRPRAECYRDQRRVRKGILLHEHFMTVLFCGAETDIPFVERYFDRIILHDSARDMFPEYPRTQVR